jgi:hypothetical protein
LLNRFRGQEMQSRAPSLELHNMLELFNNDFSKLI